MFLTEFHHKHFCSTDSNMIRSRSVFQIHFSLPWEFIQFARHPSGGGGGGHRFGTTKKEQLYRPTTPCENWQQKKNSSQSYGWYIKTKKLLVNWDTSSRDYRLILLGHERYSGRVHLYLAGALCSDWLLRLDSDRLRVSPQGGNAHGGAAARRPERGWTKKKRDAQKKKCGHCRRRF